LATTRIIAKAAKAVIYAVAADEGPGFDSVNGRQLCRPQFDLAEV
jgi:hypothetical protein